MRDEARFLRDVAQHQMTVIKDDGLYRHLRFAAPGTSCMHFNIVTWPGYLCYSGDMGSYVFSRVPDMFEFFRAKPDRPVRDGESAIPINPQYWAQKVEASDRHDGITEFDEEAFKRAVLGDLIYWLRSHRAETSKEERRELWEAVIDQVIDADGGSKGDPQQMAAYDFDHRVNEDLCFALQDFFEHNVSRYTLRFLWCCWALVWGIGKYDELMAAQAQSNACAA